MWLQGLLRGSWWRCEISRAEGVGGTRGEVRCVLVSLGPPCLPHLPRPLLFSCVSHPHSVVSHLTLCVTPHSLCHTLNLCVSSSICASHPHPVVSHCATRSWSMLLRHWARTQLRSRQQTSCQRQLQQYQPATAAVQAAAAVTAAVQAVAAGRVTAAAAVAT